MNSVGQSPRIDVSVERTRSEATSSFPVHLITVFLTSATIFLFLRSSDYLSVDGALRALQVYQAGTPFLHGNNHLLYPFNIYLWTMCLDALGLRAGDSVAFLKLAQAMNAIAAATVLTVLYGLSYKLTNRIIVAAMVTIGYGLSRAFLAHATNSAEPMVGLFWGGISFSSAVYGVSRGKPWASTVGGLALAVAMASYQSMVLAGVSIVFLLWQWPRLGERGIRLHARVFSVIQFGGGFAMGLLTVYGIAYYLTGTQTAMGMFKRFVHVTLTQEIYTHVTPTKIVALLPGLAYALFPCLPRECDGFRCLAEGRFRGWIPVAGMAVLAAGLSLAAMLCLAAKVSSRLTDLEKVVLMCCAIGLFSTMYPLIYLPTYDKLWLEPLAFLFIIGGILLNAFLRVAPGPTKLRYTVRLASVLIIMLAASNLVRAANLSFRPTPYLHEAQELSFLVSSKDLLVGDWDGIFLLYQAFEAPRANSFNVASDLERNGPGTLTRLTDEVSRFEQAGGSVFFLGLLDLSEREWKTLIGARGGPPFDEFQAYRRCAVIVKSFPYHGRTVTLRRLSGCTPVLLGSSLLKP
jgi:hypothetical protein